MSNTALLTSPRKVSGGRVEILPPGRRPTLGQAPLVDGDVVEACRNYDKLGAPQVSKHILGLLQSAQRGSLLRGDDGFSRLVKRQICIHSMDSEGHLPDIGLTEWEIEAWTVQNRLKHLDSKPESEREGEYVRLLNDRSIDPAKLHLALCVRIADMTEPHAPETVAAAEATKIPGILPIHRDWKSVALNYAESILRRYRHMADYAGLTPEYRMMRTNAMAYLYPNELRAVVDMFRVRREAIERTNAVMLAVASKVAERLGLNVLVAFDMASASSAYDRLAPDTVVFVIRRFKGEASLLMKQITDGKPPLKAHDPVAEACITDSVETAFRVSGYIHGAGLREAYAELGSRDVQINDLKNRYANPDPLTRYRAIHIHAVSSDGNTVNSEVQVRDLAAEMEANYGSANHVLYKTVNENRGFELKNGELKRFRESNERIISSGG